MIVMSFLNEEFRSLYVDSFVGMLRPVYDIIVDLFNKTQLQRRMKRNPPNPQFHSSKGRMVLH